MRWGDNKLITVTERGSIDLVLYPYNRPITLEDVLYVPTFELNLISQGRLQKRGAKLVSQYEKTHIYNKMGDLLAEGQLVGYITELQARYNDPRAIEVAYTSNSQDITIWHQRMGHIGENALEALRANTDGVYATENCDQLVQKCKECPICIQAKATKIVSRQKPRDASEYLEKVHSDICGPIKPQTPSQKRYFCLFTDDKTRYTEATLLREKGDVYMAYKTWKTKEETQSGLKIKQFHADNAGEYKSDGFIDLHTESGTIYTYSAPYTPA